MTFAGLRITDALELQYKKIKTSFKAKEEILTKIYNPAKTTEWYFTFLAPKGVLYCRQ
jgi:hypothetical protein